MMYGKHETNETQRANPIQSTTPLLSAPKENHLYIRSATYQMTQTIEKQDDLEYDLGLLLATDVHPLAVGECKTVKDREVLIRKSAQANTQLLVNKLFALKKEEGQHIAVLPPVETKLPRQKPAPQPKPETKWDKYAKEKGIENRKRERMVWDEETKAWVPRWGYKSITDTSNKDWVLEYKGDDDMNSNLFDQKREEKKMRVMKNKQQMLDNKLRSGAGGPEAKTAMTLPAGLATDVSADTKGKKGRGKERTTAALKQAQISTASLGRFDEGLKGEPKRPNASGSSKRKFQPAEQVTDNQRDLKILDKVLGRGASRSTHSHGIDLDMPTSQVGTTKRKKGKR